MVIEAAAASSGRGVGEVGAFFKNCLRTSFIPKMRAEVKKLCDQSQNKAKSDPWLADKATDDLLTRGAFLLWGTDNLLPEQSIARNELHNELTKAALSCQYEFGSSTGKWPHILKFLEKILCLTTDPLLRQSIEEQSKVIRGYQEAQAYWCGEGYYDLPDAIYLELEQARELVENEEIEGTITALVDLYRRTGLQPNHKVLVGRPLAWSLNRKATENLNSLVTLEPFEEDRKIEVARVLRKSAYELLLAAKLDSANSNVLGNLSQVHQVFVQIGLKMPDASLALMYFKLADEPLLHQASAHPDAEVRSAAKKMLKGVEPDFFPPYRPSKPFHHVEQVLKNVARYWLAVTGGIAIIAGLLSQNSSVQKSQPVESKSFSYATSTPSPTIATRRQTQMLTLEREIEAMRTKISGYDNELTTIESQLDEHQTLITSYRDIISNCRRARQTGEEIDEFYCRNVLETHNQVVAEHNSLLQKARVKQSARNQLVKQMNAKIDRYNAQNLNR